MVVGSVVGLVVVVDPGGLPFRTEAAGGVEAGCRADRVDACLRACSVANGAAALSVRKRFGCAKRTARSGPHYTDVGYCSTFSIRHAHLER